MKFEIELDKMPTTQQQKGITYRNGKPIFYNRQGVSNNLFRAQLLSHKPKQCFESGEPLKLSVIFWYSIKQKKKWSQFKTTPPDLDNLLKNLQDYMTEFKYYADDSQIVSLHAEKYHANKNKIRIEITEVENDSS